jgi:hypothetical protein
MVLSGQSKNSFPANYTYSWYKSSNDLRTDGTLVQNESLPAYDASFCKNTSNIAGEFYYYCVLSQNNSRCLDTSNVSLVVVNSKPENVLSTTGDHFVMEK